MDAWQDFENAMNQAKDVLDNADATANEIANAFEKLMDSSVNLGGSAVNTPDEYSGSTSSQRQSPGGALILKRACMKKTV